MFAFVLCMVCYCLFHSKHLHSVSAVVFVSSLPCFHFLPHCHPLAFQFRILVFTLLPQYPYTFSSTSANVIGRRSRRCRRVRICCCCCYFYSHLQNKQWKWSRLCRSSLHCWLHIFLWSLFCFISFHRTNFDLVLFFARCNVWLFLVGYFPLGMGTLYKLGFWCDIFAEISCWFLCVWQFLVIFFA